MKKRLLAVMMAAALVAMFGLAACNNGDGTSAGKSSQAAAESASSASASAEAPTDPVADASRYGYAGTNPVEAAAYKYMAEEASKNFEKADASIPIVNIVHVDFTNPDEVLVYGDFWVDNYNVAGDTLECVSGGNFPGVMHMSKDGDGYIVSSFDMVEDGENFDASAKQLFGDNYDAFMNVYGDDEARAELRKIIVSDYVNLNGLAITQFQDYGWDPVQLYK